MELNADGGDCLRVVKEHSTGLIIFEEIVVKHEYDNFQDISFTAALGSTENCLVSRASL